jgi:hypothetical protein
MADQDLATLGLRMVGIGVDLRHRVLKHGDGLLERHTVRLGVGSCLGRMGGAAIPSRMPCVQADDAPETHDRMTNNDGP